jgi:hypothetical protein
MKHLLEKYLLKEAIGDVARKVLKNLANATADELSAAKSSLSDEVKRLKSIENPNVGNKSALKNAEKRLADIEGQIAKKAGKSAAEEAAEEAASVKTNAQKTVEPTEAPKSAEVAKVEKAAGSGAVKETSEAKKITDQIKAAQAAGLPEAQIDQLKGRLARELNLVEVEVDNVSKNLQKLQSDYEAAVKTSGADSPRAKQLKQEMEKLNGVTTFTKIRRFCTKVNKEGLIGQLGGKAATVALAGRASICLALLGAAGYAAFSAVDSVIDPEPSPTPKPTPKPGPGGGGKKCSGTLKYGCTGENIRELQQKLLDCGQKLPRKGVDGWFGSETKAAVQSFQEDSGLKADGIAGANTMQALNKCNGTSKKEEVPEKETPLANEPQVVDVPATEKDKEEFNKAKTDFEKEREEREALRKQYGSTNESLKRRRNEQLEKLVFERLVKGCK